MKRRVPLSFAVFVLLLAAGGYFAFKEGDAPAPPPEATIAPADQSETASRSTPPARAEVPSAPLRASLPSSPKDLFSTANPYALAQQLRAQRQPGTFALAAQIDSECRESIGKAFFMQSLGFGTGEMRNPGDHPQLPVASASLPPGMDAQRIAAMQEIQARCRPFVDDPTTREPLPGDDYGRRYKSAFAKTNKFSALITTDAKDDLKELASQGVLWLGHPALAGGEGGNAYLYGQLRGGLSRDDYRRAIELAYLQATSSGVPAPRPDLRALTACMYYGLCDSLDSVALRGLPPDSASIPAIRSVAAKIAAALQANDPNAFARPQP